MLSNSNPPHSTKASSQLHRHETVSSLNNNTNSSHIEQALDIILYNIYIRFIEVILMTSIQSKEKITCHFIEMFEARLYIHI